MNLEFLFSTANQLRHASKLKQGLVIGLLIFSLVLQVTGSILLLVEHMTVSKNNHRARKRFRYIVSVKYAFYIYFIFRIIVCIVVKMILMAVIHVLITAFGGPDY